MPKQIHLKPNPGPLAPILQASVTGKGCGVRRGKNDKITVAGFELLK